MPLHGYRFEDTPLWAGIYMLPLTAGFLVFGPVSGFLSDRFGARGLSMAGVTIAAAAFIGLLRLPIDFLFPIFATLIFAAGRASACSAPRIPRRRRTRRPRETAASPPV